RIVGLASLQSIRALKNQHLGLREMGPEFVQGIELIELFLSGFGLARRAQGNAQVVMRLLEVRLESNGFLKRRDGAGRVAGRFELHAKVAHGVGTLGIEFHGAAELGEGSGGVALAAKRYA